MLSHSGFSIVAKPETELSRWADGGGDFVIGWYVPRVQEFYTDEPSEACLEGSKLMKRWKEHLAQQQRHRCQEFRVRLSLGK